MKIMLAAPVALSKLSSLELSLTSVIRGKAEAVRLALVCLLARGHLLIEDVPGVGKTTLAHALARSVDCGFHRLQFTSDMLPSDVLGVTIYNARTEEFEFRPGPIFTNFVLADEINRATPKTQSALLEAMNEVQITIEGRACPLPQPFMVIATQNPVEHHGTYPLPESQLDRFLLRLKIGYPSRDAEMQIVRNGDASNAGPLAAVITSEELLALQEQVHRVAVDDSLVDYLISIVEKTRAHEALSLGVSPRGARALYRAAQALAMVEGREYMLPDDIKRLTIPVCAHRIAVNSRATLSARNGETAERILNDILTQIDVPL
ncbi:MAG TPA: MoxR family ATPase [Bryobacteraceae bacterium]|nr:MoxR family ATPase [Bryobacteraceae bacterium]